VGPAQLSIGIDMGEGLAKLEDQVEEGAVHGQVLGQAVYYLVAVLGPAFVVEDVGVDGIPHVPVGVHFAALAVVSAGGLLCGGDVAEGVEQGGVGGGGGHGGVPGDGLKLSGTINKE